MLHSCIIVPSCLLCTSTMRQSYRMAGPRSCTCSSADVRTRSREFINQTDILRQTGRAGEFRRRRPGNNKLEGGDQSPLTKWCHFLLRSIESQRGQTADCGTGPKTKGKSGAACLLKQIKLLIWRSEWASCLEKSKPLNKLPQLIRGRLFCRLRSFFVPTRAA